MKRPVAHAVKNRKTFGEGQGFFMKPIRRKSVIFMSEFQKDENATRIYALNPHF